MPDTLTAVHAAPGAERAPSRRVTAPPRVPARAIRWALAAGAVAAVLWLQRDHLAEIPAALTALADASASWLWLALAASAATYVMGALAIVGTVERPVPFLQSLQAQMASGFVTLAAPAGLGSAGMNVWFLERIGLPRREAVAAALRNGAAGGAVHVAGLVVVLLHLPGLIDVDVAVLRPLVVRAGTILVAALALLAVLGWWQRSRIAPLLRLVAEGWGGTAALLRRRDRAWPLLGGSLGLTVAYGVTLWACARAVGIEIDLPTALAVEVVVQTFGALGGTPGGVGVVEAAGLQGLLLAGARPSHALAAVLLHRLITLWFPVLPGVLALRRLRTSLDPAR